MKSNDNQIIKWDQDDVAGNQMKRDDNEFSEIKIALEELKWKVTTIN